VRWLEPVERKQRLDRVTGRKAIEIAQPNPLTGNDGELASAIPDGDFRGRGETDAEIGQRMGALGELPVIRDAEDAKHQMILRSIKIQFGSFGFPHALRVNDIDFDPLADTGRGLRSIMLADGNSSCPKGSTDELRTCCGSAQFGRELPNPME